MHPSVRYLAEPTAFDFAHPIESEVLLAPRFVYLSFVTQTTIGHATSPLG